MAKIKKIVLNNNEEIFKKDLVNVFKKNRCVAFVQANNVSVFLYASDTNSFNCYKHLDAKYLANYLTKKFKRVKRFSELPKWFFKKYVLSVSYET